MARRTAAAGVVASLALVAALCCERAASSCPCEDPSLCEPIKGAPKKEVLGFVTSQTNWPGYNWTTLTTVAMFTALNDSLLCYAHSKGVRVVLSASYDTSQLNDSDNVKVRWRARVGVESPGLVRMPANYLTLTLLPLSLSLSSFSLSHSPSSLSLSLLPALFFPPSLRPSPSLLFPISPPPSLSLSPTHPYTDVDQPAPAGSAVSVCRRSQH